MIRAIWKNDPNFFPIYEYRSSLHINFTGSHVAWKDGPSCGFVVTFHYRLVAACPSTVGYTCRHD